MMKLSNWGNYPVAESDLREFRSEQELERKLRDLSFWIPRGMGRCYGDSALAPEVISTRKFSRMISFDSQTGLLKCESGVSLKEIIDAFLPRGWFLPVTPGTKYVSVGGALASDIHGKNHHKDGAFSDHVTKIKIRLPDGLVKECSADQNAELFHATAGGMGLTGLILEVSLILKKVSSAYIRQNLIIAKNLNEILEAFSQSEDATYSVAWIDCLAKGKNTGRSVLMLGEHATADDIEKNASDPLKLAGEPSLKVPVNAPGFALNKVSVSLFNKLYYGLHKMKSIESIVHYDPYFYPLDSILEWNRIYGKRGFLQYQFVIPVDQGEKGLRRVLDEIASHGAGSFLAVLKLFGNANKSLLGFPDRGYTLALDFPIKTGTFELLDRLDKIVIDHGGRFYLTKDARMSKEVFQEGYPQLEKFLEIREKLDPNRVMRSLQSERLGL